MMQLNLKPCFWNSWVCKECVFIWIWYWSHFGSEILGEAATLLPCFSPREAATLLPCFSPTSMQGMVHGLPTTWRKDPLHWEVILNGLHFDTGSEGWSQSCTGWDHCMQQRARKASRCSSPTSRKFWRHVLSKRTNDHFLQENDFYLSRPMTLDNCR